MKSLSCTWLVIAPAAVFCLLPIDIRERHKVLERERLRSSALESAYIVRVLFFLGGILRVVQVLLALAESRLSTSSYRKHSSGARRHAFSAVWMLLVTSFSDSLRIHILSFWPPFYATMVWSKERSREVFGVVPAILRQAVLFASSPPLFGRNGPRQRSILAQHIAGASDSRFIWPIPSRY